MALDVLPATVRGAVVDVAGPFAAEWEGEPGRGPPQPASAAANTQAAAMRRRTRRLYRSSGGMRVQPTTISVH
jgi:hypothetical protein